jgi:hypothetical protein
MEADFLQRVVAVHAETKAHANDSLGAGKKDGRDISNA